MRSSFLIFAILVTFFFLKVKIEKTRPSFSFKKKPLELAQVQTQSEALKQFSFGFNSFVGSLLWIELLQSADSQPLQNNELSQEFSKLLAMSYLDPRFEPTYSFGNSFLSILRADRVGAYHLLKRWTEEKPLSWRAHFYYGFHCYHEMNLLEEGAQSILKSASLPKSPPWLNALGVGILSESGQWEIALQKSIQLFPTLENAEVKQRLEMRVRAILQKIKLERFKVALEQFKKQKNSWPDDLGELSPFLISQRQISSMNEVPVPEELLPLFHEKIDLLYDKITHEIKPKINYQEFLGIKKS